MIVLNPNEKMAHFKKHWNDDLQEGVLDAAEKIVRCFGSFVSSSLICTTHSSKSDMLNSMASQVPRLNLSKGVDQSGDVDAGTVK
jgi:hypothetical protein